MTMSAIAINSGSMSSTRNFVPDSERFADEPNSGCSASRLSRVIAAWKGPALSSISTVPALVDAASASGSILRRMG